LAKFSLERKLIKELSSMKSFISAGYWLLEWAVEKEFCG
jgi:hypothetical protein